ncbi:MAG: hypothetical protein V4607_12050 [Pseudomonadota bacterium]
MTPRKLLPVVTLLTLLAGCQSSLSAAVESSAPAAANTAPTPCAGNFAQRAGTLTLANTKVPTDINDNKNNPLYFANKINVSKPLTDLARVSHLENGWSSFALSIQSQGAQSISVHISKATLPRGTEIWLCAPDGLQNEGPYSNAIGGDVWTPVVAGDVVWLDVLVPTAKETAFKATLAEVFGGFR